MNFDEIKQNILNSSETSTSESESISNSELHEEFEINNFLPEFEPLKLSGKNLAQQYVSAFNTGMNVYQCLNYLQGYVYTLVTAMNETIEAWNTVVPLLEQATKEWTDEEFDYKWSILKPQVIELVTNLTLETFNNAWEELKPVVIKLAQDTTDAEFKKQWDILKPQVITLVEETTTNKFNEEWEKLRPTIIQLSTDTTIEQFNRSWEELRPQVIELSQQTTSDKFDEKWEELRPQVIELAQTTTSNKFDEKWEELQPTLTETVNNLAKTQTTTTFNEKWEELRPQVIELSQQTTSDKFDEKWEELRPQVIELAQTTTSNKFDEKWEELQPTLTETVNNLAKTQTTTTFNEKWEELRPQVIELTQTTTSNKFDEKWEELQPTLTETVTNLVNTNLDTFKNTLWQEVTKNDSFPFLLPENFGAVGDGTTDDSTAFNTCISKANETDKYILLSNKTYYIGTVLISMININMIGIGTSIKLGENNLTNSTTNCYFKGITFYRDEKSSYALINNFISSKIELCTFKFIHHLFDSVKPRLNSTNQILLDNCYLYGSSLLAGLSTYTGATYEINNIVFESVNDPKTYPYFIRGTFGGTIVFNNCTINKNLDSNVLYYVYDNLVFNNCIINANHDTETFHLENFGSQTQRNIKIIFKNCTVDNSNKIFIYINNAIDTIPVLQFINTDLKIGCFFSSNIECSLWLENNFMNKKPSINSRTGKVNLVEIQQKYSDTSENIFPWANVSLIKNGTTDYYVLTESKDKNVKKLDYYFKYDFNYLPNAPYYTNNIFIRDLDLEGYTVKRSLLSNNTCNLKNKSTSDLIDYVYLMLDDNVTVTTTKNDAQMVYTEIAMKYLPYFAKLKTDTPFEGHLYVDSCISIILEKTSS